MKKYAGLILAAFLTITPAAYAASAPVSLGTYGDWSAAYFLDGEAKVCYMQSKPVEQKGAEGRARGPVFLFVTHWQAEKTKNVVSIAAGYPYKKGSRTTVRVDGQAFQMAAASDHKTSQEREMAWTEDQTTDDAMTQAMLKGSKVEVEGVSQRGTKTTDIYSLKGSAEAYRAISKECGFE